jgi:single-stranded DNA-binding protein
MLRRRSAKAKKGDRVYIEASLTLNTWETAAGETKTGLNVAAWKCEKVPGIGKEPPAARPR